MEPLLQTKSVCKYFGDFEAVKNLSFSIYPGEIFGIAGPNGAGKSTLFNLITGVPFNASSGEIIFEGREIQKFKAYQICRLGISRTFQIPVFFQSMTYLENVMIGAMYGGTGRANGEIERNERDSSLEAIDFVGLLEKKDDSLQGAPVYDLKRLMLASGLVSKPKLLLLDEPIGGLTASEIEDTLRFVNKINEQGTTIAIIEHVLTALMGISDRVMILNFGEKIAEGIPKEVSNNEDVIEAYLGKEYHKWLQTIKESV